jgi:uncharacterized spore protein YtfJ
VIRKGEAKLLQMTTTTPYQNAIVNTVPEVVDKIIDFIDKKTKPDDELDFESEE